ncbi:MAG: hypothetical protein CME71_06260 [Halobacteriovorax sp.]|nr:hypothetical protein [Halobacteriovorax sp.]
MAKREANAINIAFLDLLSGALGAVIILFVAVPKSKMPTPNDAPIKPKEETVQVQENKKDKYKAFATKLDGYIEMMEEQQNMIADLENENKLLKEEVEKVIKPSARAPAAGATDLDSGFKYRGKNIVLIIDVSGSMNAEDRIGQVKAGLKMLVTSMSQDFRVDVVNFPGKQPQPYDVLWGRLQSLTKDNKTEIYKHIGSLRPDGGTPTRQVLDYALAQYKDATDIILLTDGAPTTAYGQYDNIYTLVGEITKKNRGKVQINAIGVGSSFLLDKTTNHYLFLEKLARDNGNGFFFGF